MPYSCQERECRKHFSVRKGTVMQSSKLGYRKWLIAVCILFTGLKGAASRRLRCGIGIT